jgi:hypothetical protein
VASDGPADDCVVDKIQEFAAELANPPPTTRSRSRPLKFLLHFVGDLHQPLHSSDDHDRDGNDKKVSAAGFRVGNLHHFWDTEFVDQLETDPKSIAADLIGHISKEQEQTPAESSPHATCGPRPHAMLNPPEQMAASDCQRAGYSGAYADRFELSADWVDSWASAPFGCRLPIIIKFSCRAALLPRSTHVILCITSIQENYLCIAQ